MRACSLIALIVLASTLFAAAPFTAKTKVSLSAGFWEINGKPTHEGSSAEGLLMNVSMLNAAFDDSNAATKPKGFDADANTAAFIKALPDYAAHGVRAISLNLQGANPGYAGAINSAYKADGSLDAKRISRVQKIVEACDAAGVVVILGCFQPEQDQVLSDTQAVEKAVKNTAKWISSRGYTNVVLEIAHEQADAAYDHANIKDPELCAGLIGIAKEANPSLLVSSSGASNGRVPAPILSKADFLLVHFTKTPLAAISARIGAASKVSKAIVCKLDAKIGDEGVAAVEEAVFNLCSWGYSNQKLNQEHPFEFGGSKDDPGVYAALKKLTSKD